MRREGADNAEVQRTLANCLAYLGFVLSWESRQPEAEAKMNEAVSLAESLAARHPHDANIKQDLWRTYQTAAVIYEEIDNARMFELGDKARKIAEETVAADRANTQARHNLARSLPPARHRAFTLEKSRTKPLLIMEKAAAIYLELMDKDPLNRGYDADAGSLYSQLGGARGQQRDYPGRVRGLSKKCRRCMKRRSRTMPRTCELYAIWQLHLRSAGELHAELVETTDGETRQTQLAAAKDNFRRALDLMLNAQAQKTLPECDLKNINKMRAALEKLEKMR